MLDFITSVLASGITLATPVFFASLGELVSQRSGVMNLSLEGIMLMSAFFAVWGAFITQSLFLGILIGTLIGGLMGLIHAFLSVIIKADQVISGLALWIFGTGASSFFFRTQMKISDVIEPLNNISIPILSEIPVIGPSFFNQNILVYVGFILVPLLTLTLTKTTIGLKIRSIGENPLVADSLGLNVGRTRFLCVMFGALLAGLGGASLTVGLMGFFSEGMTVGMGWIAFGLVFFGNWNAYRIFGGGLLFGFIYSLQMRLQTTFIGVPYPLFLMLPYVIIILILVLSPGIKKPGGLGIPYKR